MQILHQGHVYQIEDVLNPDCLNKMLVMNCVEINYSLKTEAPHRQALVAA